MWHWLEGGIGKTALPNASNDARLIFSLGLILILGLLVLALLPLPSWADGLLLLLALLWTPVGDAKATAATAGSVLLMSIWMFAGVPPWAVLIVVAIFLGGWCWANRM